MATPKTPGRRGSKPPSPDDKQDNTVKAGDTPVQPASPAATGGKSAASGRDSSSAPSSVPASGTPVDANAAPAATAADTSKAVELPEPGKAATPVGAKPSVPESTTKPNAPSPAPSSPAASSAEPSPFAGPVTASASAGSARAGTDPTPAKDEKSASEKSAPSQGNAAKITAPAETSEAKAASGASSASTSGGGATPPPAPTRSGGGFFALLLGGVAAAAIGFVMARYVLPEGWPLPGSSPLQTQIEAQAGEIADLRAELAALPPAPDPTADIEALRGEIAALRQEVETPQAPPADLIDRLDQIEARLATVETRTDQPEGVAGAGDVADLEAAITALQQGLAAQEARTNEAAEATRAEIARIQSEAEAARQASAAEAGATLEQAALAQIEAAAINGSAYGEPLASLAGAGYEIPQVLSENAESGLPTLAALIDSFDDPARAAIAAELRADMGDSLTDRVGSFLRAQTGARSLTPRDGTDADAVLSRAEAALRSDNVEGALTELAALSEPAKAEMAAWVLQAERHRDARAALAALSGVVTER